MKQLYLVFNGLGSHGSLLKHYQQVAVRFVHFLKGRLINYLYTIIPAQLHCPFLEDEHPVAIKPMTSVKNRVIFNSLCIIKG